MKLSRRNSTRSLLGGAIGFLFAAMAASSGVTPAKAQAHNAADLCTPDVFRLCNQYIPDAERIVVCLKAKRRQLSPGCRNALQPTAASAAKRKSRKSRPRRRH